MRRFDARSWLGLCLVGAVGCGVQSPPPGGGIAGPAPLSAPANPAGPKWIAFVGFDTSAPAVDALRARKIQGLVVENPALMGELGVRTLVAHLEKTTVEPFIDPGVAMITPAIMGLPSMAALLDPPQEQNASGASLSGGRSKTWKILVIPRGTSHSFWKAIHAGAKKAADELGMVELIWQGPAREGDPLQQIQLVQHAVAARVDGIVLAPADAKTLARPVEEAAARGIPVVVIDSALDSMSHVSFIATDHYQGGVIAARRLAELIDREGKIILLRVEMGDVRSEARAKGFTDTIAREFPKITCLSNTEYAGPTAGSAQKKAESLVTRFGGQIDGIFCPNETTTEGMVRALDAAGMLRAEP